MKLQKTNLGKVSITVDIEYWKVDKTYDRLVIVQNKNSDICYISRKPVPGNKNIQQTNREYWIPLGKPSTTVDFSSFTILSSVEQLPASQSEDGPYLIDGVAYFWVGNLGDTLDGKYQSIHLEGQKGDDGLSAYEIWLKNGGDPNTTEADWLLLLKGKEGPVGPKGDAFTYEDFTPEQLANLQGPAGTDGKDGKDGLNPSIRGGIWYIGNQSTGVPATGPQGPQGESLNVVETNDSIWILFDDDESTIEETTYRLYQMADYAVPENIEDLPNTVVDFIGYTGNSCWFKLEIDYAKEIYLTLLMPNSTITIGTFVDGEQGDIITVNGSNSQSTKTNILYSTTAKNIVMYCNLTIGDYGDIVPKLLIHNTSNPNVEPEMEFNIIQVTD